jgi:murein L,D-transpeptidase YcbB/YkuD
MIKPQVFHRLLPLLALMVFLAACKEKRAHIGKQQIVEKAEEINLKAEEVIQGTLEDILSREDNVKDSFIIRNAAFLHGLYKKNNFKPFWSEEGQFKPWTDSLLQLVDSCRYHGLFPEDYAQERLVEVKGKLTSDTSKQNRLDAAKWAHSDLLFSAAFVQVVKDLTRGRLVADSVLLKDSVLTPAFFSSRLLTLQKASIENFTGEMEPQSSEYARLKEGLRKFLTKASFKKYTFIRARDSLRWTQLVFRRLKEEDSLKLDKDARLDSVTLARAIARYQKRKGMKVDSAITQALVDRLNLTDGERFLRLAITMDKWKGIGPLPKQYIWVNIPSYYLQVKDSDTVALRSRVVVGKPKTRTPVITSQVTNMVTYPKWHIPQSIIEKEILPGLKRDPGYTQRRGYSLVDTNGNDIDPYKINWSKYKKMIPYKVVQGSGDENALGVMKFNFPNDYDVYLHDTNQRYLFSKNSRALSHGCVRVQAWHQLAYYLLQNDSLQHGKALAADTLDNWLANKQKHYIPLKTKVPLYIRYLTCETNDKGIVFYEDIYGEDRRLREKYFSSK